MEQQYLSIEEAAKYLGVTPYEMEALQNSGEIMGVMDRGRLRFAADQVAKLSRTRAAWNMESSAQTTELSGDVDHLDSPQEVRQPISPVANITQLRRELLAQPSPITSDLIIEFLSTAIQLDRAVVEVIVDGFWNDVIKPEHYKDARPLIIPHFGTFRLKRQGDQTALMFRSKPIDAIRNKRESRKRIAPNERWIKFVERNGNADLLRLSVKRRMAVRIANDSGQDLHLVHRVLWEMIEVTTDVFLTGDKKIRWAMRGEMAPVSWRVEKWYEFRCYQRLVARLPRWDETQRLTGLTQLGSTGKTAGKWPTSRAKPHRKNGPPKAQGPGCLSAVLIVIVVLAGLFVSTV